MAAETVEEWGTRGPDEAKVTIDSENAAHCNVPFIADRTMPISADIYSLEVSNAKRLRSLEEENARLKRLLADTMLDNPVLSLSKGRG